MLHNFLIKNREEILALIRSKTAGLSEDRPTTEKSERGLPQFYDHLVSELERERSGHPKRTGREHGLDSTTLHGEELSRLGYTVSQVVHGYGAVCQGITELAHDKKAQIGPDEFSTLNLCLDKAIADAVTGFAKEIRLDNVDSTQRMGFLVHELRNSLAAAMIAQTMIKKSLVGAGGRTNALLERTLHRMRDILDRSFTEVRIRNDKEINRRPVFLFKLIEEVEATVSEQASQRGLKLDVEVDPRLKVVGDPGYLISALSNLVQNAIKYTKEGSRVRVRGRETDKNIVLEVEDECGGLPEGKAKDLFKPYTQKSSDRTGLGLGLTISRRAVELNGGTLTVQDLPGRGCIFQINLPRSKDRSAPARRPARHARPHAQRRVRRRVARSVTRPTSSTRVRADAGH